MAYYCSATARCWSSVVPACRSCKHGRCREDLLLVPEAERREHLPNMAGVERICYSYPRPSDETLLHKAVLWGSFELLETVCLLCL